MCKAAVEEKLELCNLTVQGSINVWMALFHQSTDGASVTKGRIFAHAWILNPCFITKGGHTRQLAKSMAKCAPSPSCFPRGKFSNFCACTGILRPVTPHRLALCPPLGQIVIFIYQLIAMLPALSPPSQETHVKRMKTGRQFHPSAPPSRTPSSW